MMAALLEESDYTGAFDRITEMRSQLAAGELSEVPEPDVAQIPSPVPPDGRAATDSCDNQPSPRKASTWDWATLNRERENQPTIRWLAPIELDPRRRGLDMDRSGRRPSCRGFGPISLAKHLRIVVRAGRRILRNTTTPGPLDLLANRKFR